MTPELALRSPEPSDLAVLRALHDAVLPVQYELEFYESLVREQKGVRTRVAVAGDELVGFITWRESHEAECAEHSALLSAECRWPTRQVAYILTLGVSELHRRRGVAAALLDDVLRICAVRRTTPRFTFWARS